ncbi:usherin isoform X2 [Protopterus annectens]|uniref:usherin isoform X2 n=1 Tax=Protopterus annectens TaxID=7888 RepID=UPI001CFAE82E|nr:usherin isoform X2 [Protopterus annectens]
MSNSVAGSFDVVFTFWVAYTIDMESGSIPVIQYYTAAGLVPAVPTSGEKTGKGVLRAKFYTELWFIILMAVLGLVLFAIFLTVLLRRKLNKPFERERPPLVPLQKRTSPMSVYPPSETYMGMTDTKIPWPGPLIGNCNITVHQVPSQSHINQTYAQDSLQRSVGRLADRHDKKSLTEDAIWDTVVQTQDNSMYVEDEDFMDTIKGISTVTKEHTTFTDTPL